MTVFTSLLLSVMQLVTSVSGFTAIGAGMAGLTGLGAGIAMGIITSKAEESIARQPEAAKTIRGAMLFGLAFAETTAIYGVLVAILIMVM